jgi:putative SOS response-associated peptidase YedK
MIERYAIRARLIASNRSKSEWHDDLIRTAPKGEMRPADVAPVITGDPNDGIALHVNQKRWGMPNHWMMSRGLDPLDGPLLCMKLKQTSSGRSRVPRESRCLVPVTSLVVDDGSDEVSLRDPNRPLLTLAGLISGVQRGDIVEYGFCFLTQTVADASRSYDAPLVVAVRDHDEWFDGWHALDQALGCCNPLIISRLVHATD